MKFLSFTIFLLLSLLIVISGFAAQEVQYQVGVNDTIDIKVIGEPQMSTMATVASDGTITFPYLGSVYIKGMSVSEIKNVITEKLSNGYVKFPVVTVSLIKSMSRKIFIYGESRLRGEILFDEGTTLEKALSLAGGVTEDGLFGNVIVRRKSKIGKGYKDIAEANIENGFILNQEMRNMPLQPDDILSVERNQTFLVEGEVTTRGRFVLEKNMTAVRALLQAGGIKEDGLYGTIKIRRKQDRTLGGYKDIIESKLNESVIENKELEDYLLQPDDILVVEHSKTFLIEGEVMTRGRMVLEKNMTVLRALLQAGGIKEDGLYGMVKIRRKQSGNSGDYKNVMSTRLYEGKMESKEVEDTLLQADDILIVERNKTFLIEGEVASRGRLVLEKDITVLRALLQAGGVKETGLYGRIKIRRKQEGAAGGYKDVAESKLNEGVMENKEVEDILLQPDDILSVESNELYYIYGEINLPGDYIVKGDTTVFKAVILAKGFTKWGSKSKVKVLRPSKTGFEIIMVNIDDVIKGDAEADIKIQGGDTIIVSEGMF